VGGVVSWLADSPLALLTAGLFGVWRMIPLIDAAWVALNASFLMTPIGAAIGTVVALGAAFVFAYEKFEFFRNGILDGWEGLKVFFGSLGQAMSLIASQNWVGLIALSNGMDVLAAAKGRQATLNDKRERLGLMTSAERRAARREGKNGLTSLDFADPNKPGGTSLGDAAGLNSTVGNSKSNTTTINIGSLIAKSEISVMDFKEGLDDIESKLIDALLRVANSGARAVTA
jgi:hypothetical protein